MTAKKSPDLTDAEFDDICRRVKEHVADNKAVEDRIDTMAVESADDTLTKKVDVPDSIPQEDKTAESPDLSEDKAVDPSDLSKVEEPDPRLLQTSPKSFPWKTTLLTGLGITIGAILGLLIVVAHHPEMVAGYPALASYFTSTTVVADKPDEPVTAPKKAPVETATVTATLPDPEPPVAEPTYNTRDYRGCRADQMVTNLEDGWIWLSDDCLVRRNIAAPPQPISNRRQSPASDWARRTAVIDTGIHR